MDTAAQACRMAVTILAAASKQVLLCPCGCDRCGASRDKQTRHKRNLETIPVTRYN